MTNNIDRIGLPESLPEKPVGWTRKMLLHMNFGSAGGAATFTCYDQNGKEAEFGYQYDTRPGGLTGFVLPGVKDVMTWDQLRAAWPAWVAGKTGGAAQGGE